MVAEPSEAFGKEVSLDEFTAKFQVGDEVLVGTEGDRVTIIRPVH